MVRHLTAILTKKCNLSCPYCYEAHNGETMSLEMAMKCLALVKDGGSFTFFGGEPLLCFENLVKPLTFEAHKRGIQLAMTTNVTLLTPQIFDWLTIHRCAMLLSFDGDKPTQDRNRPLANGSSFDMAIENLKYALSKNPNQQIRMTLHPTTLYRFADDVKFFYDLCVKRLSIAPNLCADWNGLEDSFREQVKRIEPYKEILYFPKGCSDTSTDMLSSCGLGLGNKAIVTPDGKFYGCHRLAGIEEWCVGDIEHGFDEAKREAIKEKYKDMPKVECIAENIEATGNACGESSFRSLFDEFLKGGK